MEIKNDQQDCHDHPKRTMGPAKKSAIQRLAARLGYVVPEFDDECKQSCYPSQEAKELHLSYRQRLWEQSSASIKEADNIILTVSSALFGISIALWKEIPTPNGSVAKVLFFGSSACFILAIALILFSHHTSYQDSEFQIKLAEAHYARGSEKARTHPNPWRRWTQRLNLWATIVFIVGLVSSLFFALSTTVIEGPKGPEEKRNEQPRTTEQPRKLPAKRGKPERSER
jgi:hypothetical protein